MRERERERGSLVCGQVWEMGMFYMEKETARNFKERERGLEEGP